MDTNNQTDRGTISGFGVDRDLAEPDGSLKRVKDSGKYIYKINQNRFEVDRWNRDFEQYKERREKVKERKMKEKLDDLNKPIEKVPVYNLPLGKILINTKDAIFDILDDTLQFKFEKDTLLKENRLFYIGLSLMIIACVTYLYFMIIGF
jgi:hypothetical protein